MAQRVLLLGWQRTFYHIMREIGQALVMLLDNPDAGLSDVMQYVQGPDYPTEAEIITAQDDIKNL